MQLRKGAKKNTTGYSPIVPEHLQEQGPSCVTDNLPRLAPTPPESRVEADIIKNNVRAWI
jgi:hypothetical protein